MVEFVSLGKCYQCVSVTSTGIDRKKVSVVSVCVIVPALTQSR